MDILEIGKITQNFGILDNGILGLSYYVCFLQFDRILNEKLKLYMNIKTFYEKKWLKEGKKIKYLSFSIH